MLDGQSVTLTKPLDGSGFGMNIDANCCVLSFLSDGSVAKAAGVKLGTTIVRINAKRVKNRQEIVAALGPLKNGDQVDFVLYTKEQLQAISSSRVKIAVETQQEQEQEQEQEQAPQPEAQQPFVSRFGKGGGGGGEAVRCTDQPSAISSGCAVFSLCGLPTV